MRFGLLDEFSRRFLALRLLVFLRNLLGSFLFSTAFDFVFFVDFFAVFLAQFFEDVLAAAFFGGVLAAVNLAGLVGFFFATGLDRMSGAGIAAASGASGM
jgi:hypothetical protein